MTTYTWPTSGGKAFWPQSMTWTQRHNNRMAASPLSGAVQTTSLPGSRWGVTLDFSSQSWAERAELEGFLTRLSGQGDRLALWDLARSTPAALGGAPLVNGALAQFASTLNIDGTIYPGRSLLRYTQSLDNAVWTKTNVTIGVDAIAAVPGSGYGTSADKIAETAVTGVHSVQQNSAAAAVVGQPYTLTVHLKAAERSWALITLDGNGAYINLATGAFGTINAVFSASIADAGGGWWRVALVRNAATTALPLSIYASTGDGVSSYAGTAGSGIYAWGVQIESGPVATDYAGMPTVSIGDWLRLPLTAGGSQLVQAVSRVEGETLPGIEFRPMLRGAVADNAAVTIVNPSALFVLASPELSIPRGANGRCPPFSIELIEVFA